MLHLYNLEHLKIKGLKAYKDYCIESTLSTGDKVLSFLYPSYLGKDIIEESYIRTKTAEFVVKEIDDQNQWKSIKAVLNVEDLEGKEWEQFDSTEQTITDCLRLAIAGTGWTIGTCNVTRRRTVRKTNCSAWEVIQEAKKRYRVEIEFDTLNKKINIAEKLGTDKGVYFMDSLNLKNLSIQGNSYDFYTRIIAKGKEDLKVTVENFQYSNKIKTLIWKDERYTQEASLKEDATAKLEELSKPYRAYSADILDLANMSQKYKDILEYSLGDTITLISKENGIREKQRLVTIREYPDEPQRNTCEIANTTLKFEDIQKEYQDTTDTVNNITADDGTISEEAVKNAFTVFNKINANEINVLKGQFGELKVNKLDVDVANIKFTEINKAIINKADIVQLNAVSVKVKVLEGDSASFKNVLAGNITADNIQTKFLQTLQGWMLEGSIGNAQISDLNANKIRSGTVDTSLVTVAGPGGRLQISGNKLQVFDSKSGKLYERIMLGIDNNNNSSLVLRGADGNTVLITQDGLTKAGFTDGYNKLDNNSLDSSKLDINSVVRRINGSTEKIESTVIQVGNKTLNVLLQEQNNTITEHGKSLSTQEARITANENSIKLKVDTQTYSQDKTTINKSIETTLVNSKAYADTKKNEAISTASADATTKSNNAKNAAINTAATDATTKANAAKDTAIAEAQKKADKALADSKLYVNQEITTVNSNLSKATSDISVLKGQIALKVEQSDIDSTVKNELITKMDDIDKAIADVITTTDTKISKAKADIKIETDKIALNVSNLTTKTSTIETQLGDKATKAEVKTVSDKAASIEANLNGITQRVSSTESTVRSHTTQIGAVDGKINTAKTDAINTAGADAQKKADNAKNAAINTAATDATNKANKAKTDAISTASADATTKANNALKDGKSYTDIGLKPVKDTLATHTIEINTTKQQVSTIETNLGSITSRVSTVENKTTTIDGKLIKQETRLQSAENKLTPTSIVSSVNEALNGNSSSISTTSTTLSKNSFEVRNAAFKLYDTYGDLALSSGGGWTYTQGKYQVSVSPHNKPRVRGVTLSSGNCNVLPYGIVQETFNSIPLVLGSNSLKVEIRNMIDTEWGNLEANSISAEGIHSAHGKGAYLSLIRNELNIGSGASSSNLWLNYFSTVEDPQVVVGNGSYGGWGHLSAGSLYVTGSKNCIQETENYGYRAINAYETADYYLGDIGEGNIGEDGLCYVSIDDVFMETVNTKCNYQVFLTKYGKGDIWVKERTENYFIVEGTPGLLFGGEIKAKRKGYETDRLEIADIIPKVSMDFRLSKEDESTLNMDKRTYETLTIMNNSVKEESKEQSSILNSMDEEVRQKEMEREQILEEW
ncbi:phage tail spike protein [Clostridium cadaveris]|uniref:phage tail spike protein n=1 Tax=Clostridium cadaveris TaxID=1529 RepID=UPI0039A0CA1D